MLEGEEQRRGEIGQKRWLTEIPLSSSKQALRSGASAQVADVLSGELFSPAAVSVGSRAVRSVDETASIPCFWR